MLKRISRVRRLNRIGVGVTNGPVPVASFDWDATSGDAPLTVLFNDTSTNSPTSWHWQYNTGSGWVDFADAFSEKPSETFTVGTYSIRLTASNANGSNIHVESNLITVTAAAPTISGTSDASSITITVTSHPGASSVTVNLNLDNFGTPGQFLTSDTALSPGWFVTFTDLDPATSYYIDAWSTVGGVQSPTSAPVIISTT